MSPTREHLAGLELAASKSGMPQQRYAEWLDRAIAQAQAAPQAEPVADDLDSRMKAAGMLSVAQLLAGAPLDEFFKHRGVHDLDTFGRWLEMRRAECLKMQARFDLDKRRDDELYDWIVAHAAVFSEVHVNFKAAVAHPAPDAELVELLQRTENLINVARYKVQSTRDSRLRVLDDIRAKLASLR